MRYTITETKEYPLKDEMAKRRVSVAELANKLKMQRSYLHKIVARGCGVSGDKAQRIIKALEEYNV